MSNHHEIEGRTIHPRALAELGEDACIVAIGVARDLRSGEIPPEKFDQDEFCGSAYCIAGHIAFRMGIRYDALLSRIPLDAFSRHMFYHGLFAGGNPSDPILAADAIERYVFLGSKTPWQK